MGLIDVNLTTPPASKVTVDDSGFDVIDGANAQAAFASADAALAASGAALTAEAVARAAADSAEVTARNAAITTAINAIVNGAPGVLDTLKELADALGDDAAFATTVTTALAARLKVANNLSDLDDAGAALTNLGLDVQVRNHQTGTSYTLALTDSAVNAYLDLEDASAIAVTVPLHSTVSMPTYAVVGGVNAGAGVATFSGATSSVVLKGIGVTVDGGTGIYSFDVPVGGGAFQMVYLGSDTWQVFVGTSTITSDDITDATTAGKALLTATDVAAQRTAMELGSAALEDTGAFATAEQGDTADAVAAAIAAMVPVVVVETLPGTPDEDTLYFITT